MKNPEAVIRWGTAPNGRPIYLTRPAAARPTGLVAACRRRGFTPTVVQGSWMRRVGGGAAASAGFHDEGGAIDFRVWDLTEDQRGFLVREARRRGGALYLRGAPWDRSGMDPHAHVTLGWDAGPKDSGLMAAWRDYLGGGNGLSGRSAGRDPHWRPNPLVTTWRPPVVYRLTRGGAVDAALAALAKAEPARGNVAKVKAAATALRSIEPWKVKR